MAAPIAMAALAGSFLQSRGQRMSAASEERAYLNRAFASELDAMDFETQALLERASTGFEAERLRGKIDATKGAQRAAVAASGIELSGSAAQVLARSAEEQELDALMLRFGGLSRELGRERSAATARMNADTLRMEGKTARQQGKAAGSANLLTGAVNAAALYRGLGGGFGNGNNS